MKTVLNCSKPCPLKRKIYRNLYTLFTNGGPRGASERSHAKTGHCRVKNYSDWVNMSVLLCEDDTPGSSLAGGNPAEHKTEELRFWLKYRNDSGKGLRTKVQLVKQ